VNSLQFMSCLLPCWLDSHRASYGHCRGTCNGVHHITRRHIKKKENRNKSYQATNDLSFTFTRPCIVTNFFIIKPTRCTNFTNLFCHETLFRTVSLSIIRSLFAVHSAMVYVIQVCKQLSSRTRMEFNSILVLLESCVQTCMTYTIAKCTVKKLLMMDRGNVRNM